MNMSNPYKKEVFSMDSCVPKYKTRAVYIVLSQTQTKFGRCIRAIAKQRYNHASIALDSGLTQLYAFARPQHCAVLQGRLVRESLERYTMGNGQPVPVAVYRIPVSEEAYQWVSGTIENMVDNPEYMYNLFSVLTYPIFKGFPVYHAFSCVEFIAYLLHALGYLGEKPFCRYKPDDLLPILKPLLVYQGDIRGCLHPSGADRRYFAPLNGAVVLEGIQSLLRITKRSVFYRVTDPVVQA